MIKGNIKSFMNYDELSQGLQLGLNFLKDNDLADFENGRYEISGNAVYASVQDYTSKPIEEGKFEAHRKYIDIQFVIKGEEKIGIGNVNDFSESTQYNDEKDIVFLESENKKFDFVELKEGDFAIFYPKDAHMPCISLQKPDYVKKVVIKVLA